MGHYHNNANWLIDVGMSGQMKAKSMREMWGVGMNDNRRTVAMGTKKTFGGTWLSC